jgi:hypothetical protein
MDTLSAIGVRFVKLSSHMPHYFLSCRLRDLNGDGNPDILWHHKTCGSVIVWYMNGVARTGSAYLPTQSDLNWKLVN